MGGGKLTRPDLSPLQPDPRHPMTEFYTLLLDALRGADRFALPGCYVRFAPRPGEPIYLDTVREYCTFSAAPGPLFQTILPPGHLLLRNCVLHVAADGAPCALLLTEEGSRKTTALQLLPLYRDPGAPPPTPPDCAAALCLQMTDEDLALADRAPAALGRRWVSAAARKSWLYHPAIDRWLLRAAARKH